MPGGGVIGDQVMPPSTLREARPSYTVEGLVEPSTSEGELGGTDGTWIQFAPPSTLR